MKPDAVNRLRNPSAKSVFSSRLIKPFSTNTRFLAAHVLPWRGPGYEVIAAQVLAERLVGRASAAAPIWNDGSLGEQIGEPA